MEKDQIWVALKLFYRKIPLGVHVLHTEHCLTAVKTSGWKKETTGVSRQFIDSQIWVISVLHLNLLLSKGDGVFIYLLLYCEQHMCWNLMKVLERCPLTLKIFKPGPEVVEKKKISSSSLLSPSEYVVNVIALVIVVAE